MRAATVNVTERVPAPDLGRVPLVVTGALLLVDLLVLVAAAVPAPWAMLAGTACLAGLEAVLGARAPFLRWTLARLAAGGPVRALLRGVALLVLLIRADAPETWTLGAAAALVVAHMGRLGGTAFAELCMRRRKMPMVTRGLDLGLGRLPAAPPSWLVRNASEALSWPILLLPAAAAVAVGVGDGRVLAAGAVLALVATLVGAAVPAWALWQARHLTRARFSEAVERALAALKPVVALYFAAGPESAYQLRMWLEPVERITGVAGADASDGGPGPALVIVRDREVFRTLGPTRLPVLCVEPSGVLMGLDLPSLRVALYPSHSVGNLHLLRRRGVVHVFVGHGDSDKPVTMNPFLKAYDEIWVSGPAARERLLTANIGVDGSRIREIGRPQLDALRAVAEGGAGGDARREAEGAPLTVLYTPTWEGYDDEPFQTSVGPLGLAALRRLLETPGVRVLYRPHPLLGTRDAAVRRAHREILHLLGEPEVPEPPAWPDPWKGRDDLEIAGITVPAKAPGAQGGSEAPVRRGGPGPSQAEHVAAAEEWARTVLTSTDRHLLVPGPQVPLNACLRVADVLLSDVSSVITEFLATGKPYGVTNPAGLPESEFFVRYPSSRGGYIIGPEGRGLDGLVAAGRGEEDPAATDRGDLRQALLGPDRPPALVRMREAIAHAVGG